MSTAWVQGPVGPMSHCGCDHRWPIVTLMFAPLVIPIHDRPTAHPTIPEEHTMRSTFTKVVLVGAAFAAAVAPSAAVAKNGADDGPRHARHRHHHVVAHHAR